MTDLANAILTASHEYTQAQLDMNWWNNFFGACVIIGFVLLIAGAITAIIKSGF